MTTEEYVGKQGMCCPRCEGGHLRSGTIDRLAADMIFVGVICEDCGFDYNDIYVLAGYEEADTDPEN